MPSQILLTCNYTNDKMVKTGKDLRITNGSLEAIFW